jgi:hypothetical protein
MSKWYQLRLTVRYLCWSKTLKVVRVAQTRSPECLCGIQHARARMVLKSVSKPSIVATAPAWSSMLDRLQVTGVPWPVVQGIRRHVLNTKA